MGEYGSRYAKSAEEVTRETSVIHVIKKPNVPFQLSPRWLCRDS